MRLLPAAMLVLAGLSVASLTIGAASVSILEATRDPWAALVLMESRLPRTLAVILTGAALSASGCRCLTYSFSGTPAASTPSAVSVSSEGRS